MVNIAIRMAVGSWSSPPWATRRSFPKRLRTFSRVQGTGGRGPLPGNSGRMASIQAPPCSWCWTTPSICSGRARNSPTLLLRRCDQLVILVHQPGAARHHRRADLPRTFAVGARRRKRRDAGVDRGVRVGAAVHRAGAVAAARTSRSPTQNAPAIASICRRLDGIRARASSWRRRACARSPSKN